MGRDRDQEVNQLVRLDTKATCFICFKPVVEVGPSGSSTNNGEGVASPGIYSLRNICRHLKLDMEMVQLLVNHDEEDEAQKSGHDDPTLEKDFPPDLKVTLCQACGVVVTRFSELLRKQELIRMEMGNCLGVVGGLLAEADQDVPLVGEFHRRMTSDINPRSFLCLRTVEELRKEMAEKCMEVAEKYPAPVTEEIDRVARDTLGTSGAETITSERAPPGPGGGSRKKRRRKVASPTVPASGRTIQAFASIGIAASPPLPPNPSPPRSLLCNQCGTTFKFPETLQAHLEIVHGLKGFKSRVNASSTSTSSVQGHDKYQQQQPNCADLSGVYTSSVHVIHRLNSISSTATETAPVPQPRIPKGRPMPQLINLAPKLPKPGRERRPLIKITQGKGGRGRKPKSGTDTEYVFNPQTGRFDCPRCSKNFSTRCACQRHFRNIHLAIRFPCEQCGKTFTSKMNRKYHHQFRHLGIRIKCVLCDATFTNPSELSAHRQSVHFGKLYACKHCSRSFGTSHRRSYHQRRCNAKISPPP